MENAYNYKDVEAWKDKAGGVINAVIEITKGTVVKNELDCRSGTLTPVRALHRRYKYIFNYGFISKTCAEDNDPMDVAVVCKERLVPGSVLPCRVVGVVKTVDNGERDDKILAVPIYLSGGREPNRKINLRKIERFFAAYKYPFQKGTVVEGRGGEDEALERIAEAARIYAAKFDKGEENGKL